jgi:hypothetical protein
VKKYIPEFEGEETLGAELKEKVSESEESESTDESADIYPDAAVNIVPESASVFQLKRKFDKKPPLIQLDPDFQRHAVWSEKQKSELLESILMGIPLPLIYVKEDDKGVYIIVDGRQRLTTLFDFMDNKFPLQKLTVLKDLNGKCFSESATNDKVLSQMQQSKIEDCPLTLHVIKPPTQDRVTFDLFDRVNRGGTRLNNQEMRNAIYQGPATKFLRDLVQFDSFKEATENSIKPDRMKDTYLVLRMISFYLWKKKQLVSVKDKDSPLVEYRSDLEDFLGKTMDFLNHESSSVFREDFLKKFNSGMQGCKNILGTGCFRLPKKSGGSRRPISMALFESVSYFIMELLDQSQEKYESIRNRFQCLLSDEKFIRSTSYIVDSNISVKNRFDMVEEIIKEIRND